MTHADNVYDISNITIRAFICKTNLPSNTAFRGFGGPQGMMVIEQVMARVANHLSLSPETVRELNMYSEGDSTPFGMILTDCTIRECWNQLKKMSSYDQRRESVCHFNK